MSFSINSIKANAANEVLSLDWTYDNGSGSVGGTHTLATPAGDVALTVLTEATVLTWLAAQIQNTTAEFDAQITEQNLRATDVVYSTPESGPYVV